MALSNILEPNFYDIFANSITTVIPVSGNTGATGAAGATGATGANGSALYAPAAGIWYMNTVDQAIPDNVATIITFDAFSNTTNFLTPPISYNAGTGLFTCTKNCTISCSFQSAFFPSSGTGIRQLYIVQSNALGFCGLASRNGSTALDDQISGSWSYGLKIGDTFNVYIYQNSGAPQNLTRSSTRPDDYTRIGISFAYEQ